MNESLHDMIPNGLLLVVSVSPTQNDTTYI